MLRSLILLGLAATSSLAPAATVQRSYANPIDVDYKFNFEQEYEGVSYRTGADPVIVLHQGAYYLFQTLADGYWRSTDLIHWRFIPASLWPAEGVVAPAVWSEGKDLYVWPSMTHQQPILVTDDPASGKIRYLLRRTPPLPGAVPSGSEDRIKPGQVPAGPWDPDVFVDDDGGHYLYWNSSNVFPLYGMTLDAKNRFAYKGDTHALLTLHPDIHGWERFGQDHSGTLPNGTPIAPFMEGAWMNKVGGRYYLQYGAPGTEYNAYATGVYVSDRPLRPFTYAPYNPVGYKPGGFVQGAGHGSTFQDAHGNWWNTGTPWIGANWTFERRVGLWPAAFAPDGQMMVSTRFGDFPHYVPDHRVADPEALFTGWMLLSYRARATASSTLGDFAADRVTDENPRSFWVAADARPGQTLTLDLGAEKTVRAVQVNFADYKAGRYADAPDIYTAFKLEASTDGAHWSPIAETETGEGRRDRPNAYFELPAPVRARYIRYVHDHIGGAHLAISDLRVFGSAGGRAPAAPGRIAAVRDADPRDARITWTLVPGAVGYNVRWGIRPDRLALTYQLFADDPRLARGGALDLRALTRGQGYYVAVEAFDQSGVSKLSKVVRM